jgi:diguanylate cyclase (GGDEF)-like protein
MPAPPLAAFLTECSGGLLLCGVFYFLYRQSRVIYFGLWAAAWALSAASAAVGLCHRASTGGVWLGAGACLDFCFLLALAAAGRATSAESAGEWHRCFRLVPLLPVYLGVFLVLGTSLGEPGSYGVRALIICIAYLYNFLAFRGSGGLGERVFVWSLLLLVLLSLAEGMVIWGSLLRPSLPPFLTAFLASSAYIQFGAHCLLGFAAMAMWTESQMERVRMLSEVLSQERRESRQTLDLDRLTGLLNQAALARRLESGGLCSGVVAVCDLDGFKEINDRYGHLVGDEILRNVGHLLRASIRPEDEAYRWGGDEFVILITNQRLPVAERRMEALQGRLGEFRVRGHGRLPVSFSWGAAEVGGTRLREALDEADRRMYAVKRARLAAGATRSRRGTTTQPESRS